MNEKSLEKKLNEHVRDHYASAEIPPETLRRIIGSRSAAAPSSTNGRRLSTPAAAALIVMFTGVSLLGGWLLRNKSEDVPRAAAREVALNHRKNLRVEFRDASLARLRTRMNRLDFPVRDLPVREFPGGINASDARLVGARYCSIQGRLAMQLRLRSRDGKRVTLFIARPADELRALEDFRVVMDGVQVRLWMRDGLLYALARDDSSNNGSR